MNRNSTTRTLDCNGRAATLVKEYRAIRPANRHLSDKVWMLEEIIVFDVIKDTTFDKSENERPAARTSVRATYQRR